MKIKSIKLHDYRAFYDGSDNEYLINVDSKNLLIYGENGSGKTSLYKAVKDFVDSSVSQIDFSKHMASTDINAGFVEIEFENGAKERFDEIKTVIVSDFVKNASKLNSFLSYRELLKTYLSDDDESDINLFDLFVKSILKNHIIHDSTTLGELWTSVNIPINEIVSGIEKKLDAHELPRKIAEDKIRTSLNKYNNSVDQFIKYFQIIIDQINSELRKILHYFNQNLEVILDLNSQQGIRLERDISIYPRVKLYEIKHDSHQNTINEARLSALAIALYFTAIKTNPSQTPFKILFLDDIFIGLDMGNRMPLLNILENEFKDWQIFITTYDRAWFEHAKRWFEINAFNKWISYEMYSDLYFIDSQDGKKIEFEKPNIHKSESNLAKASWYFKNHDYPASANYLRKAVEESIRDRFPDILYKSNDGLDAERLATQVCQVTKFLADITEDSTVFNDITIYIKSLMNPLSHYDISVQIYKLEITSVINTLEKLGKLNFKSAKALAVEGETILLRIKIDTETLYCYEIYLRGHLWSIKKSGQPTHFISDPLASSKRCWKEINGVEPIDDQKTKNEKQNNLKISEIYRNILSFLQRTNHSIVEEPDFASVYYIKESDAYISLRDKAEK